jgi:hypothetical protein
VAIYLPMVLSLKNILISIKEIKLLMSGELHRTVTGEHFRGKGLPGIKEVFERQQISNLFVISNNVFANVTKDEYNKISSNFSGTFVFWEINYDCRSSKWTI